MKRVSITRAFLVIIIILSIIVGAAVAFVMINPNVLGLLSSDGRITISLDDYNNLISIYDRYGKADKVRSIVYNEFYQKVDDKDLEDNMIKGIVAGLGDIYSGYYNQKEYEDLLISLTGEYDGVGITMTQSESGLIEVLSVLKNSPAAQAGVEVGEYIISVDGEEYTSDTMDKAAACVRGKAGTVVKIEFLKDGKRIEREITRAHIVAQTVEYNILDGNIGYIQISSFENSTTDDFKKALEALSNADSLIIDLRDNPGGLVNSAIEIADMFMDSGTVVYTQDHDGNKKYYKTKMGTDWDKEFVVLVNESSASASEIFVAGIQDNNVAKVVGTKTFGKGIIQELTPLPEGGALKLTKWQYFTPSGKQIHKLGVEPDYIVEGADEQLEKAIELLK